MQVKAPLRETLSGGNCYAFRLASGSPLVDPMVVLERF